MAVAESQVIEDLNGSGKEKLQLQNNGNTKKERQEKVEKIETVAEAIKVDPNSKQDIKMEDVNSSLLPDSPPRSPSKEEQVLVDMERDQKRSSSSRQVSVNAESPRNGTKTVISDGPTQFALHLPRAEEKALKTFENLKSNLYQNGKVGMSRGYEKEAMVCECRYRHGIDDPILACTEEADCINRLTQVECLKSECNCGRYCRNQRFQRGQYADVEVVETEKKGFGLRAATDMTTDQFIYEYIGEVVEQKEFLKRMEEYRDEGIRHFYFMMLQREEFLDATRKGGIARFVNHSCNPNCYVSKWHVGKYMRMGIFAKRDIQSGEELTFNYNVDRYGNDAQPCYCGEPNCVGTIGGKTQTDIGGMDQLFIDALGIANEVDQLEAKGTRKKKSRHLDEDFTPLLRPIEEEDVAKVITAVRQATSNRNILHKLLSRIHMTQDTTVQRCLVRLHGFVLMAGVIDEWKDDKDIVLLTMGSLARWPLLARNKVVDSGVDRLVHDLTKEDDAEVSSLASDLLSAWDTLEMSYRIARKETSSATSTTTPTSALDHRKIQEEDEFPREERRLEDAKAPNSVSNRLEAVAPKPISSALNRQPLTSNNLSWKQSNGHESPSTPITPDDHRSSPSWNAWSHGTRHGQQRFNSALPFRSPGPRQASTPGSVKANAPVPMSIEEIIRKANEADALQRKQAEEAAAKGEAERMAKSEEAARLGSKRSLSDSKKDYSEKRTRGLEEESAIEVADRRLKKLVGEIVVRCMSMYRDQMERETFKKHARELTHIICGKETRSSHAWPPKDRLADGLSNEKSKKIKDFATDYVKKLVARKGKNKGKQETKSIVVPLTPPRPASHFNNTPQVDVEDDDTGSMQVSENGNTLLNQERSITSLSHSTNTSPEEALLSKQA